MPSPTFQMRCMLRATKPQIPTNRKSPCRVAGACLRHRHAPDSLKRSLLLPHHRLFLWSTLVWSHDVQAELFHEYPERVFWGGHSPRNQLCPLKISPKCWSDLLVFLHDNLVNLLPIHLIWMTNFTASSSLCTCVPLLRSTGGKIRPSPHWRWSFCVLRAFYLQPTLTHSLTRLKTTQNA